jgi:hypothetical protein
LLLLALVVSFMAAPQAFGSSKESGVMGSTGKGQGLKGACEWFWISCADGYYDECCGSVGSCGSYCAEVCGEPCIYVG